MAKQNEFGKYILSAGEIATYVVCPQAWKLTQEQPQDIKLDSENIKQGAKMHRVWTNDVKDAVCFTRSITLLIILIVLTVLFFIIRFYFGYHNA